jgi:predicted GNAT family acetyltransferase
VRSRVLDDAAEFLRAAGPLLLANEARENLIFGIAGTIVSQPGRYSEHRFWIVDDDGEPAAAALRTPPYYLVVAKPRDDDALAALAAAIDDDLPGVVGGRPDADVFARLWAERHGGVEPRLLRSQGVYALEQVQPVPRSSGTARVATQDDRSLLLDWMAAFAEEVLEENDPGRLEAAKSVDERLDSADGGFLVWEEGRAVVSLAGWSGPTPNGIRIGPVYTPPELRGRGYATALTAELSQRLLDSGRRFCFLFTDLANPTSNAIYERIGYVRVGESAMIAFEPVLRR